MSQDQKLPEDTALALSPAVLIRKSTMIYGAMMLVGLLLLRFGHKKLSPAFAVPTAPLDLGRLVAIGLIGALLLLILSYFFEDWFPSFRSLKAVIMRLLGPCSVAGALYLALITAFGEELFFRGGIQPFAGLFLTSVLFGLLHVGQDGPVSAWSIWAWVAGLLLGWMYDATGSLWPSIITHFGVNAVSLLSVRRAYRGWVEHAGPGGPERPT